MHCPTRWARRTDPEGQGGRQRARPHQEALVLVQRAGHAAQLHQAVRRAAKQAARVQRVEQHLAPARPRRHAAAAPPRSARTGRRGGGRACVTSSACVSSKQPHCWPLRRSQNSTLPAPPAASRCPPAARQCSGSRSAAPKLPAAPRPAQRAAPAASARRARGPASAGARACSPPGRSARPTRAARRPRRRTAACGARPGQRPAP